MNRLFDSAKFRSWLPILAVAMLLLWLASELPVLSTQPGMTSLAKEISQLDDAVSFDSSRSISYPGGRHPEAYSITTGTLPDKDSKIVVGAITADPVPEIAPPLSVVPEIAAMPAEITEPLATAEPAAAIESVEPVEAVGYIETSTAVAVAELAAAAVLIEPADPEPVEPVKANPAIPAANPLISTIDGIDRVASENLPVPEQTDSSPMSEPLPSDEAEVMVATQTVTPVEPQTRFQRLDPDGVAVDGERPWSCVRDNRNDLVWEVKTDNGGLQDADHVYSWFDPLQSRQSGVRDGGRCGGGIPCDTQAYLEAVNGLGLCGFDDWRLPDKKELQSLVEVSGDRRGAAIDANYFPAAKASWYWSGSANPQRPQYAWYVLFRNGIPLNDLKARPKHIRLVRGERLIVAGEY